MNSVKQPPKVASLILAVANREPLRAAVLGDFQEIYDEILEAQNLWTAQRWYWLEALKSIPQFMKFYTTWRMTMLKNYLKVAFRNLLKSKFYSLINVIGLAVGMAVFLFISIYTRHELSYNKFHANHQSIYEVEIGGELSTAAPLGAEIQAQFPELQAMVRIDANYGGGRSPLLVTGTDETLKRTKTENLLFVDQHFFDVFTFKVIHGDPVTALEQPYSMVLTQSLAMQLFGKTDAVGQRIHYIGDRSSTPEMEMTVTAVVEDASSNSSLQFNGLVSFATLYTFNPNGSPVDKDWGNWGYRTHVQLDPTNKAAFEEKLNGLWKRASLAKWPDSEPDPLTLVPLAEIPFFNNNRRQFITLMQIIGIFVLAIAVINFINLTLARATTRAKEVGIRKVVGSTRQELIRQFLCEALLMSLIVTPVSFVIIELGKPLFYSIIQMEIAFNWIKQPGLILLFMATIFTVGTVAGLYPAVVMSSFKASSILKGELNRGRRRQALRFTLVVFQFIISTALIFSTLVISKQINYLKSKPLGFDQHHIIHCKQSNQINERYDVFKNRLLQDPNILSMTRSNSALAQSLNIGSTAEINGINREFRATTVDPDFLSTMGIELIEGRDFSWEIKSDYYKAMVVNETFVKKFDLKNPIGQEVRGFLGYTPVIVGVMKDFHNDSFYEPIQPSALIYANWNSTINIRVNGENMAQSLKAIEKVWNEISTEFPLEYQFLDETYGKLYQSEEILVRILTSFASMAILIACLGLFGLISYSAQQRTKEIGIRKVLGASAQGLMGLVAREYLLWVTIANAISLPLAAWAMLKWMNNFAYQAPLTAAPFILAGASALVIALVTVSWQAIRSANANPLKALKYE